MHTHVPVLSWTWTFHKSKVLKGVKRQMLYESSDIQRELRRWNKLFKRQGFQASLELPNSNREGEKERGGEREVVGDTKEEKERAKLEAKRFCIVITPNAQKSQGSIYSRSSSLTRSISGEGLATTSRNVQPPEQEQVHDTIHEHHEEDEKAGGEGDGEESSGENNDGGSGSGSGDDKPTAIETESVEKVDSKVQEDGKDDG